MGSPVLTELGETVTCAEDVLPLRKSRLISSHKSDGMGEAIGAAVRGAVEAVAEEVGCTVAPCSGATQAIRASSGGARSRNRRIQVQPQRSPAMRVLNVSRTETGVGSTPLISAR